MLAVVESVVVVVVVVVYISGSISTSLPTVFILTFFHAKDARLLSLSRCSCFPKCNFINYLIDLGEAFSLKEAIQVIPDFLSRVLFFLYAT